MNQKAKVRGPRQNLRKRQGMGRRTGVTIPRDNALILRSEYNGQPVMQLRLYGNGGPQLTTVTSGQVALSTALNSSIITNFAARFPGFSEFRISKCIAKMRCFASTSPGIMNAWFSEDDSGTASATIALRTVCKRFNLSDTGKCHELTYVPHDPAQQTWTLVSSGAPTIGYFKLYTDNANFGSSIVATAVMLLEYEFDVQFRGLI
jgi:hypothetical protein